MIQQVAFEMPVEIAAGLAVGKYVQYGGVIRDTAGHIVKHLEPANVSNGEFKTVVKSVRDYTNRLSKANGGKSPNNVLKLFGKKPSNIDGLKECLTTQREIISQAA